MGARIPVLSLEVSIVGRNLFLRRIKEEKGLSNGYNASKESSF